VKLNWHSISNEKVLITLTPELHTLAYSSEDSNPREAICAFDECASTIVPLPEQLRFVSGIRRFQDYKTFSFVTAESGQIA
jgi:hypothetical protein